MKQRTLLVNAAPVPIAKAVPASVPVSVPNHGTALGTGQHHRPKKTESPLFSSRYRCHCELLAKMAKSLKYQRYRRHRPIEKVHTLSRACALLPLHAEAGGKKRRHHVERHRAA